MKLTNSGSAACLTLLTAITATTLLGANNQGFYIGSSIGIEAVEAELKQSFDPDGNEQIPSVSDNLTSGSDTGDDTPYSLGAFAGYRMELNGDGTFIAVQAEIQLKGNKVEGEIENFLTGYTEEQGVGQWSMDVESEMGVVVKYGRLFRLFSLFDVSSYVLAGIRQSKVEFTSRLVECSLEATCTPDQLNVDSFSDYPSINQFTVGAGVEKTIGDLSAIEIEVRYSGLTDKEFTTGNGDSIVVPSSVATESLGVSTLLVRYF